MYTRKENIILRKYFKEFCWLLRNAADWLTDNQNRHSFSIEISNKTPSTDKTFFLFQFRDDITCLRVSTSIKHFAFYIFFSKCTQLHRLFFSLLLLRVCVSVSCCVSHCLLLSLFHFISYVCRLFHFYRPSNAALKIVFFYCSRQYMGNSKRKFDKKLVTLIK